MNTSIFAHDSEGATSAMQDLSARVMSLREDLVVERRKPWFFKEKTEGTTEQ